MSDDTMRSEGHRLIELHMQRLQPHIRCQLHSVWDGIVDAEHPSCWAEVTEGVILRAIDRWRSAPTHHKRSSRPVKQLVECLPLTQYLRQKYASLHDHKALRRAELTAEQQNLREENVEFMSRELDMTRTQQALLHEQARWAAEHPGLFLARDQECYSAEMLRLVEQRAGAIAAPDVRAIYTGAMRRLFLRAVSLDDGELSLTGADVQAVLLDAVRDAHAAGRGRM